MAITPEELELFLARKLAVLENQIDKTLLKNENIFKYGVTYVINAPEGLTYENFCTLRERYLYAGWKKISLVDGKGEIWTSENDSMCLEFTA